MPYTRTWDETQPLGSADPGTIDDIFRALKVDIRERMDSILDPAHNWEGSGDPIQINFGTIGAATGAKIYIPGLRCQAAHQSDDVFYDYNNGNFHTNGASLTASCPIKIPKGMVVTQVDMYTTAFSADLVVTFMKRGWGSGAASTVATITNSTHGSARIDSTGVLGSPETIGDDIYWMKLTPSAGGTYDIYGFLFTVDVSGVGVMI